MEIHCEFEFKHYYIEHCILQHANKHCSLFSVYNRDRAANLAFVAVAVVYSDTLITCSKVSLQGYSCHTRLSNRVNVKGIDHFHCECLRVCMCVWSVGGSGLHGTPS